MRERERGGGSQGVGEGSCLRVAGRLVNQRERQIFGLEKRGREMDACVRKKGRESVLSVGSRIR